ncbi:unnamed protein product [Phytophthora lilii]|uniref:Unnamed protein product n=1 Tax=Phytophthora lilii TaxID=2077276 RepID=A0A9W6X9E1_9STRA|nr:unnamed protein product [Phytophthora lilii]
MLVVCSVLSLILCACAQTSLGDTDGVQLARTAAPAVGTAPSSSESVGTSSSPAAAGVESSSPDGSNKPLSATVAVEAHVAQACSGSHGVSSLAPAESSSSAPSNSVVTREVLEELLMEAGAESSERVIAVLGPRLEQLGRLAVGLQVAPSIRGDRRPVQRLVKANRTLRARVQLERDGPDVLVLVSEGSLILLVFLSFLVVNSQSIVLSSGLSTGELGWEALGVSDDTRTILRQMYQSADKQTQPN